MKNTKGNKHLKKEPFMTLRGFLKDNYYVILERVVTGDCFEHIITRMSVGHGEDILNIDTAHAMLDGAIFRCKKDAETFLAKLIRNRYYKVCKSLGQSTRADVPEEELEEERKYFRVMSIKEMFNPYRLTNEIQEHQKASDNI